MELSGSPKPSSSLENPPQAEDWHSLQSLRMLFVGALATMLLLSATLNLYLYKQAKMARHELNKTIPIVEQMTAEYQQKSVPLINDFLSRLQLFSKTNPDFYPILARHLSSGSPASQPVQRSLSNSPIAR